MRLDTFHFGFHLLALGSLNFSELARAFDTHTRTKYFDLVGVHGCVGNQNFGIFQAFDGIRCNLFIEDKSFVKIAIGQFASELFDDLNILQVCRAVQTQNCVNSQVGKIVLILRQNF